MNFKYLHNREFIIAILNILLFAFIGALILNSIRSFIVSLLSYTVIIPSYYLYFLYLDKNKITKAKLLYILSLILTPATLLIFGTAVVIIKPILWLVVFFICITGFINGIINYAIINIATKNIKWYELPIVFIISFCLIYLLHGFFLK